MGGVEQAAHGVGQGPGPAVVEGQRLELGAGVVGVGTAVGEARVGRRHLGEGDEQGLPAGLPGGVGVVGEVVAAVVDDPHEPHRALGPLGVAPQPEQVLGRPGRHRPFRRHGGHDPAAVEPQPRHLLRFRGQDPGVLGQRPGLTGDDRLVAGGHAGEPPGHGQVGVVPGHAEGAQHGPAGLQAGVGQRGHGGQRQLRLADPGGGAGLDARRQFVELVAGQGPAEHGGGTGVPGEGLHDEVLEVGQHVVEPGVVAAPPGRDRRHLQLRPEQHLGQLGEERQEPGVLQHRAAQRVDHRDPSPPASLDQARHAQLRFRAQLERVAESAVDPAEDDVDRLPAPEGPDPDPPVPEGEVRPLHQGVAQPGGQQGVLEGRLRPRAGAEDDDAGLVGGRGCHRLQPGPQGPEERGQAVDLGVPVEAGKHPGHHRPDGDWARSARTQNWPSLSRATSAATVKSCCGPGMRIWSQGRRNPAWASTSSGGSSRRRSSSRGP